MMDSYIVLRVASHSVIVRHRNLVAACAMGAMVIVPLVATLER
jgi:hypothetical protein